MKIVLPPPHTKTGPSKRDLQREETRHKLYEAALEVFRRDGVAAARIDDITRAVGTSRGTFYFHFPTKEHVLVERMRASERQMARLVEGLPQKTKIADVLRAVCGVMAEEWQADPRIFPDVGMTALRLISSGGPAAETVSARAAVATHFDHAIARGEVEGGLNGGLLADIFLVNAFAGALAWSGNPSLPLAVVLENIVQLFLGGVRKRGS